jgi:hypothetical protein
MAVIRKILKNRSGSTRTITGVIVDNNADYEVTPIQWTKLAVDTYIHAEITAGRIIVNDGASDLSAVNGVKWAKLLATDVAVDLTFNNLTNGWTATNVQEAIEEARNQAYGKGPYCVSCGFDGNASSGRYLEYQSNVDSNVVGFIVPKVSILTDMSLGVQANSTVTFSVYKWDGTTETLLTTISLAAARKGRVTGLSISLAVLDELRVKCTSGSCSRPIMFQLLRFV